LCFRRASSKKGDTEVFLVAEDPKDENNRGKVSDVFHGRYQVLELFRRYERVMFFYITPNGKY